MTKSFLRLLFVFFAASSLPTLESFAQSRIPRVGILSNIPRDHPVNLMFEKTLAGKGWVDGKTIALEYRFNKGDAAQFTVNTTTIEGMGLVVPEEILLRADKLVR